MSIASYFMRNRVMGWLVTLVLLLGGLQAFQRLPRLEDPEFTIKDAMVITRYPGAAPTQVEQEVTYPIENAIRQRLRELEYEQPWWWCRYSTSRSLVSPIGPALQMLGRRQMTRRQTPDKPAAHKTVTSTPHIIYLCRARERGG